MDRGVVAYGAKVGGRVAPTLWIRVVSIRNHVTAYVQQLRWSICSYAHGIAKQSRNARNNLFGNDVSRCRVAVGGNVLQRLSFGGRISREEITRAVQGNTIAHSRASHTTRNVERVNGIS